jgi:hypothetical protein
MKEIWRVSQLEKCMKAIWRVSQLEKMYESDLASFAAGKNV